MNSVYQHTVTIKVSKATGDISLHEESCSSGFLVILLSPLLVQRPIESAVKPLMRIQRLFHLDYVYVECEVGAYECYQYRGTKAMTNAYGDFTVVIDAGNEEDGIDILLTLRGENFTHIRFSQTSKLR